MKRKVLIVTLNDYVIYQPTILNLYDEMIGIMDVKIISFEPSFVTKTKDTTRNIIYLSPPPVRSYLIAKWDFLVSRMIGLFRINYSYQYYYYHRFLPSLLRKRLKKEQDVDIVIAVDLPALKVAQHVYGAVHFLSLEIENRESPSYRLVDPSRILSVLIQSQERIDYMFPGLQIPVFIVQNSPVFDPEMISGKKRNDFIFSGTARTVFGIFECIEFIRKYPPSRLVQKGGGERKVLARIRSENEDLLREGRLLLDDSYVPAAELVSFLSGFRIGFCFYSWDIIEKYYNYRTAPSGKLFMYMAAGVPVIASDIDGFQLVRKYGSDELVKDYSPATIKKAVEKIEANFDQYSENCLKLASEVSFDKMVTPYISFLQTFPQTIST